MASHAEEFFTVPSHQAADRRERLRKLEQGHIRLGKMLQEAMGLDTTIVEETADGPVEQPAADHAPAPASASIDANGGIAVLRPTVIPDDDTRAVITTHQGPVVTEPFAPRSRPTSRPPSPTIPLDHPVLLALEARVEELSTKLKEAETKAAAMSSKAEALARNLVKIMRERNQFEQELAACKLTMTSESHHQQTQAAEEKQLLSAMLRAKEAELRSAYDELDRLAAQVAKQATTSAFWAPRNRSVARNDTLGGSVGDHDRSKMQKLEVELNVALSQRDTLAVELQLSAACIETLDQRLMISEQELLHSRLRESAVTAAVEGPAAESHVCKDGSSIDVTVIPLSVRKELARLCGDAKAMQLHLEHTRVDAEARIAFAKDTADEAKRHASAMEAEVRTLLQLLSDERTAYQESKREVERLQSLLQEAKTHAATAAAVIVTPRSDFDEAVRELEHFMRTENAESITRESSSAIAGKLRGFIHRVGRDFAVMAPLLSFFDRLPVEPISNPTEAPTVNPVEALKMEERMVTDPGVGRPPIRIHRPIRAPTPPQSHSADADEGPASTAIAVTGHSRSGSDGGRERSGTTGSVLAWQPSTTAPSQEKSPSPKLLNRETEILW